MNDQEQISILRADVVEPMSGPTIRNGAVAMRGGRIVDVGRAKTVIAAHPHAAVTDLGRSVLLPGLVNPHTHLELSLCEPCDRPASFIDWILSLRSRAKLDGVNDSANVAAAVDRGVTECLRFGVTTVGDISRLVTLTRPSLRRWPIRAVSFGEVLAIARFRDRAAQQIADAIDPAHAGERLRIGITPHATYTLEPDAIRQCLAVSQARRLPLAMHVAELPYEDEFLAHGTGPFRDLLQLLQQWDEHVPRFAGGPIRFVHSLGLLDHPTLLAHVNYCDDAELALLAAGRASVVYCPRTHALFDHPPHRWQQMLAAGVNVAIGTDSRASSPDLNLVDDLRLLRRLAPQMPAQGLFQLATTRAAKALQMEQAIGSLTIGHHADVVAFPASDLASILDSDLLPTAVWINGQRLSP